MISDIEYKLWQILGAHIYDASANPDKVGLGKCRCGEDMYWCNFHPHLSQVLIKELNLENAEGINIERYALVFKSDQSWDEDG